ncbi:MAG: hypothetical protein ACJ76I_13310 [Gaiellaceae bacterium]
MAATLAAAPLAAPTSATPIGPLPSGPTSVIQTQKGELVAVSLPNRANGRVWRIARAFNAGVIAQVGEADVGTTVVLVFKATGTGTTTLSFGLTRGDTGRKAFESRRFQVHVR